MQLTHNASPNVRYSGSCLTFYIVSSASIQRIQAARDAGWAKKDFLDTRLREINDYEADEWGYYHSDRQNVDSYSVPLLNL